MRIALVLAAFLGGACYWSYQFVFYPNISLSRMSVVSDIKGLHEAVSAFRTKFDCRRMPSRIRLSSKLADMDEESLHFLRELFPNPGFMANWNKFGMVWNNLATGPVTLEGDQCLVFFLGGPQIGGKPVGWSTDPSNATALGGPRFSFYDFPLERLRARPGQTYLSFYGGKQPYAYFSSSPNHESHCQSLGLLPYGLPIENVYQIISAGRDGCFGTKVMCGRRAMPPRPIRPGAMGQTIWPISMVRITLESRQRLMMAGLTGQ